MSIKPPAPPPARSGAHDNPDAPASEEEVVASEALRRALADPGAPHAMADFARALALAHAPRPIDTALHGRIVERAIAGAPSKRGRVIRVSFGMGAALVLAAGVTLVVGSMNEAAPPAQAHLTEHKYRARSTQDLFDQPFGGTGGGAGSARIDRIAMARASDFRENEFSRWGTR